MFIIQGDLCEEIGGVTCTKRYFLEHLQGLTTAYKLGNEYDTLVRSKTAISQKTVRASYGDGMATTHLMTFESVGK